MNSPTCDDFPAGPLSEAELRDAWNARAGLGTARQWNDLELCEQLDWAQARAVAVDRSRRGTLPQDYIDSEHQGMDRALLEAFYQACAAEGGTADEIHLRGIKAAMLQQREYPPAPVTDTTQALYLQMMAAEAIAMRGVTDIEEADLAMRRASILAVKSFLFPCGLPLDTAGRAIWQTLAEQAEIVDRMLTH